MHYMYDRNHLESGGKVIGRKIKLPYTAMAFISYYDMDVKLSSHLKGDNNCSYIKVLADTARHLIPERRELSEGSFKNSEGKEWQKKYDKDDNRHQKYVGNIFDGNVTDALYHYYIMERTWGIGLITSVLDNIRRVENRSNYRMTDEATLSVLSKFLRLPNTFSRTLYVRYAFEHIGFSRSFDDFWQERLPDTGLSIIKIGTDAEERFDYYHWLRQVDSFVNFFEGLVFPLFEGCFLDIFLTRVEEYKKALNIDSEKGILKKAAELLSNYMEYNFKKIMRPVSLDGEAANNLDLLSMRNFAVLEGHFDGQSLSRIREKFRPTEEACNMGIIPLNPEYIKTKANLLPGNIRNQYLNAFSRPDKSSISIKR